MNKLNLEEIKATLTEMGLSYTEGNVPDNLVRLTKTYGYTVIPIVVDLTSESAVDAELGILVQNNALDVDNGVYIFTVLHSGQAGFMVVQPSTVSRAPFIRKVTGDITSAIDGIDLPPLMPFDMVEITAHMLTNTFMHMIMESCHIPKEYKTAFLRLYMPKFLANVGLYFVGATNEDGSPMIYETIANMEPMMVWNSIQKGAAAENESGNTNTAGETKDEEETEKNQTKK